MSKQRRQKGETKKARRRQNVQVLVSITSALILIVAGWLWYESTQEDADLSAIGMGENVVVQVHDPGWGSCIELKRVVNSLKPEYEGKIRFLTANLNSSEGKWFAEYQNVGRVTLLFFKPDGSKISSLSGEQEPEFLRNVFNKVFDIQ